MLASNWEFKNRAWLFGLIVGISFPLYALDPVNASAAVANWLGARQGGDPDTLARLMFFLAACLLAVAALIRTWASSYLNTDVVYASEVKTASLVADGPYRRVRNPLYLANILMGVGMGALMSRLGFFVAVTLMVLYCYRLILREEADLQASQGESYRNYLKAVPRLLPSLTARTASAGRPANWGAGLKAELWYWGFAAGMLAFAITLKQVYFFAILAVSLALFWFSSAKAERK